VCTAIGMINRGPPYRPHCCMQLSMVDQPWHNFSKSRILHAKMGHVNPTPPPMKVICLPYARTCYDQRMCQICADFKLPYLHLMSPLGVTPFELGRDLCCQKTRVPGVSRGIVRMIISLAVLIQYWYVTDTHTTTTYTVLA